MKNIKKSDIALILGVVIVIAIGIFAATGKEEKIEKPVTVKGEAGFKEIAYSEYEKAIESEEPFIIMLGSDTCSHCINFQPVIEKVSVDKKIPIKYLNINKLSEDESKKLSTSNNYLKNNEWGTPTTIVLKGKRVVGYLAGETEEKELIKFLDKNVKVEEDKNEK